MRLSYHSLLLPAVLLLAVPGDAFANTPPVATGGDEIAWAYRMLTAADGKDRLVFAYAESDKKVLRFYLLPMRQSSGVIRQTAVRGPHLHVFFRDGGHYRFRPPLDPLEGTSANEFPKNDFPERVLPSKRVPKALCGDDVLDALFAIVTAGTADAIPPPPATQPADDTDTNGADAPAAATPSPEPADEIVGGTERFALVTYRGNHWSPVARVPAFFDEHEPATCRLAARGGRVWLLFSTRTEPDALQCTQWHDAAWSAPQTILDVPPRDVLALTAREEGAVLVVRRPLGDDTFNVVTMVETETGWKEGAPLSVGGGPLVIGGEQAAFARMAGDIVGVWIETDDKEEAIRTARWPADGGDATGKPEAAPALMPRKSTIADERTRMLVTTLLLTSLLLVAFMKRRENFLTDLPAPPGYVLARLGKRFVAFMIDFAILSAVLYPTLAISWMKANGVDFGEDVQRQINHAYMQDRDGLIWRWMIGIGVYALYGIIFEAIWAATPGKLALGLRVCNNRAESATLRGIILRNVLRFEVYPLFEFAPVAILVALTRNRQRLGDLVANTIVVERV